VSVVLPSAVTSDITFPSLALGNKAALTATTGGVSITTAGACSFTGETESTEKFFPNGQGQLKDYNLDDVFSDLTRDAQGRAHMTVKGKQQQLEIVLDPTFKSLVMYSPNPTNAGLGSQIPPPNPNPPAPQPARAGAPAGAAAAAGGRGGGRGGNPPAPPNFVCFEPMAGISDAMNLAQKGLYK